MSTSVTITAIIAALFLANSIVIAVCDVAKTKYQDTKHCESCTCNNKENRA